MVIVEAPSTTLWARKSTSAARITPRASTPPWRKKLASSEASTACSITFGISLSLSITRRSRAKVVKTVPLRS